MGFSQIDLVSEEKINTARGIKTNPDVVVHFAGLKAVSESEEKPFLYWNNNFLSSIKSLRVHV